MKYLNKLETELLERLSIQYEDIKEHIPYLLVVDREITGVGMYVNLTYSNEHIKKLGTANGAISTNENIEMKNLQYGLGYEVNINNGMIEFIEFITYGEEWDGQIDNDYKIVRFD